MLTGHGEVGWLCAILVYEIKALLVRLKSMRVRMIHAGIGETVFYV